MIFPLNLAAAVASSDEGDLRPGLDPSSVTPGTLGFIFTLLIVVAVIFLIRDMTKRIRRVRYNAMLDEGGTGTANRGGGPAGTGTDTKTQANPAGGAEGRSGSPAGEAGSGSETLPESTPGRDVR